jgi:eukaryotic-like serine/threonine-protein kinase
VPRKPDEVVVPSQEDIDNQQNLLAAHRRTLAHYLMQQASLGTAYTPPGIVHGIHESRQAIQRIKAVLHNWNVAVDDLPDDEEIAPPPFTPFVEEAGSPRRLKVFLCHSSGDKPAIRNLYQRLRAEGIAPWLDEEDLVPGQDWRHEIPKAVRESDIVIICLSRQSATKIGYVQKEIKYALDVADEQPEGTIFLIPLKLEECDVPERLRRWQWVNFFEDRGYEKLMRALQARATAMEAATIQGIAPSLGTLSRAEPELVKTQLPIEPPIDSPHTSILKLGQIILLQSSKRTFLVEQFLGGGGQGEVYRGSLQNHPYAMKWYYPDYPQHDSRLRERLEMMIKYGAPSERFLWPIELASAQEVPGFGYIMPLREPRFKSIIDMMKRRVEPSLHVIATVGFEVAHSFLQLHAKWLCYRDISFGNFFFDPDTGEVRISDNDNVDINNMPEGILGTPRFMPPETLRGEAVPSTQTDLFALAVLLFYLLFIHHPLEGKKESDIEVFDIAAIMKIYGTEPVFIFDPDDDSNRPVPGYHDNAIVFWQIYPNFLRNLFIKAFTKGLHDPSIRINESEWCSNMVRLRDLIIYCKHCGAENFFDPDILKVVGGCWSCNKEVKVPPRIHIGKEIIMLNHDTKLFLYHLSQRVYDFSQPVAVVKKHRTNSHIWDLQNLSGEKWLSTMVNGTVKDVEPGQSITLSSGIIINFGRVEGEIRI